MDEEFNFEIFSDEIVEELSKFIKPKQEELKKILEYLLDRPAYCIKKDLRKLFPTESPITVDNYINALESSGAIICKKKGTSKFYEISPIGEKMLKFLKGE